MPRKAHGDRDVDFLKEGMRVMARALMEPEVGQRPGAERHERGGERTGYRNGHRERPWDTRAGTIEPRVPRVRDGSFFPALLEPRRRAERALAAVVQEASVQGVSTRRVDELVKALGMEGVSKSPPRGHGRCRGCARRWTRKSSASAAGRSWCHAHMCG